MQNLKAKSIAFVFLVWAALFGLMLYKACETIKGFTTTLPQGPLTLEEILNKNQ